MLRLGGGGGHAGGKSSKKTKDVKKKAKASSSSPSSALLTGGRVAAAAAARVTDEDLLLGLMDEMGSSMLGGDAAVAPAPPAAPATAEASSTSSKKGKKRPRPPSSSADDAIPNTSAAKPQTAASDGAGAAANLLEEAAVSRNEVWDPTRRADMDTLNLPWWGRSVAAAAAAPRLPLPDPRAEVARFAAAKELRAWLLAETTGAAGHAEDIDMSSSNGSGTKAGRAADRAFHRWLRGSKLTEQATAAAAAHAAGNAMDPVLPSTPASGRDLAMAQALTSAPLSLSAEAAVEACEGLAARAGEAARRLAGVAGAKKQVSSSSSSLLPRGGGGAGAAVALHPLSRLDQPPVLRSRHHRPCLYLPLSAPKLGERLELLQENEALEVSLLKGHVLRVNDSHYQKLRALYTQQHVSQARPTATSSGSGAASTAIAAMSKEEENLFHERLGCLLFRYQSLAAEDQSRTTATTSAAGVGYWERLERSLPPLVFDVLAAEFGVAMECFASPFNCRFARYCSGQWDVDGFFGSLGPFLRFEPLEGAFVAHPPAVPEVIDAAIKHMERLLARTARGLAFFLVVPGAKKEKETAPPASTKKPLSSLACVRRLLPKAAGGKGDGSPFLAWHLHLAPGSYGLVRGDQHCRLRSHVPGKEEGLLLLALQSQAARAAGHHALTPARERLLRHAFASFEAENGRDKLAPPPPDITVPVCTRGGEEEWWW